MDRVKITELLLAVMSVLVICELTLKYTLQIFLVHSDKRKTNKKLSFFFRRPGEPPLVPGHFLLGNGKQFTEHAVKFLQGAHKKCGDVFTIRFLNQHWTMLLDIHSYERFAKEKNFDFDAIQEQVNNNVFGYHIVDARKMISEAGQKVNGKHLFTSLENFAKNLTMAFRQTASEADNTSTKENITLINNSENENNLERGHFYDSVGSSKDYNMESIINTQKLLERSAVSEGDFIGDSWCQDHLRNLASKTFFSPVFYTIFGRSETGMEGNFHPQVFHKNFDQFHKYFNFLWLGMPVQMFPRAVEAAGILAQQPSSSEMVQRTGCSDYIKFATEFMLKNK